MKRRWIAVALVALSPLAYAAEESPQVRTLAGNCANCHGTTGRASGAMPSLAGMAPADFVAQLQQFRDGSRPATVMHQIVKGYRDEEIAQLADFFARQPR